MLARLKDHWSAFKQVEPGKRFQAEYRRHQESEARKSPLRRVLHLVAGVVALALGVVLSFIPGPAIPFFLIAGSLFAMHSLFVARALDWLELELRPAVKAIRKRFSRRRATLPSHR